MKDSDSMDAALERIINDMDDMEGKAAMSHTLEECPDPMNCTMHDDDVKGNLTPEDGKSKTGLTIIVGDGMMPKLGDKVSDGPGSEEKSDEGLSPEEAAELRKILTK